MRKLTSWGLMGLMLVATGCAPIKTKTPLATCPMVQKTASYDNGTIFQPTALRPLFEDRHARNVGDEVTIMLGEATTPTEKSSANKGGKVNAALPSNAKDVKGAEGSTVYSGSLIATVIVVMDNGKLLVCGDKLVKYANSDLNFEYVRVSGVVSPETIGANNTVPSAQVADVQIEYRNADSLNATPPSRSFLSRLSRFFLPKQQYF
jgi:flagellar L-ring protein precursor FlgH